MARTVFLAGAGAWLVLAALGLGISLFGRQRILAALPPLIIDADAIGGALTAIAVAAFAIAAFHAVIAAGLARDRRWARTTGILTASTLAIGFLATSAALAASAVRETALAAPLAAGASVAALAAVGYAIGTVRLVREIGSGAGT